MEQLILPQRSVIPVEHVVDGVRHCRHHPGERIPREAAPCKLCRIEGNGIGELATDDESEVDHARS